MRLLTDFVKSFLMHLKAKALNYQHTQVVRYLFWALFAKSYMGVDPAARDREVI